MLIITTQFLINCMHCTSSVGIQLRYSYRYKVGMVVVSSRTIGVVVGIQESGSYYGYAGNLQVKMQVRCACSVQIGRIDTRDGKVYVPSISCSCTSATDYPANRKLDLVQVGPLNSGLTNRKVVKNAKVKVIAFVFARECERLITFRNVFMKTHPAWVFTTSNEPLKLIRSFDKF